MVPCDRSEFRVHRPGVLAEEALTVLDSGGKPVGQVEAHRLLAESIEELSRERESLPVDVETVDYVIELLRCAALQVPCDGSQFDLEV